MKKIQSIGLLLTMASLHTAQADISVTAAGSVPADFTATPAGVDWASVSVAGGGGDLAILGTAATGIDVTGTGVSDSLAWPTTATDWTAAANVTAVEPAAALAAQARYVTVAGAGKILTGPTGNRYTALVGRFQNDTVANMSSFQLGWTLGIPVAPTGTANAAAEVLRGIHLYVSSTGLAGTWSRVAAAPYRTAGAVPSTIVTLPAAVTPGSDFYLAWIDDNGPGAATGANLEGQYTVDDVAITPAPLTLTAVASAISRDDRGTLTDPLDDNIVFTLTVAGAGPVNPAGWEIVAPELASTLGTGAYGTPKIFTVGITEFTDPNTTLILSIQDQGNPSGTTDVTITPPRPAITPTINNFVYSPGTNPLDPVDDTMDYTASATGLYAGADVLIQGNQVAYGTPVNLASVAIPTGAAIPVVFTDVADPTLTSTVPLQPYAIIGEDTTGFNTAPVVALPFVGARSWTMDPVNRTATQVTATQVDHVVTTQAMDLSTVGLVKVSVTLVATPKQAPAVVGDPRTGSGFEAADSFACGLLIDGATVPVSILGNFDQGTPDGRLTGAVGLGTELPGTTADDPKTFVLTGIVPASANSLQIQFIGNSNSAGESLVVSGVKVEPATPTLIATAGAVTFDNKGTVSAADDDITRAVTITTAVIGASTGWTATGGLPASGNYADAQPVIFSAPALSSPASITITDTLSSAADTFTITRPAATLTAVLVAGSILRNENGAGATDDTVTFRATVTGNNAGPQFTIAPSAGAALTPISITGAGAYPVGGGEVTFTVSNLSNGAFTATFLVADASYPTAPAPVTLTVALPTAATAIVPVMGRKSLGAGLLDLGVAATPAPAATWLNFAGLPAYVMNAGPAGDVTVESETLDLSAIGEVLFTAKFRAADNSTGSNFESGDRFKAELLIDGTPVIVLPAGADIGAGLSSVASPGDNGSASGFLNGYTGVGPVAPETIVTDFLPPNATYTTAALNYNANKVRDEFNFQGGDVADAIDHTFDLAHTIPAGANSVKLIIYGAGANGSEAFTVRDVLFTLGATPVDSDSDGMPDDYETANSLLVNTNDAALDKDGDGISNLAEFLAGTGANDATSALRVRSIVPAATAGQYTVTWASVPGKSYQLEESDDLGSPDAWASVGAVVPAAAGPATTTSATVTLPAGVRHFVRAKVRP